MRTTAGGSPVPLHRSGAATTQVGVRLKADGTEFENGTSIASQVTGPTPEHISTEEQLDE